MTRLWFAWACFFRVLVDGAFAARAFAASRPQPEALPPAREATAELEQKQRVKQAPRMPPAPSPTAALQLLALFQREGRLVDFLEQDIAGFSDTEIGAAARVV